MHTGQAAIQEDGFTVRIHMPETRSDMGTRLAPSHPWSGVFNAADYRDQVPQNWIELMGPGRAVYFVGVVDPERTAVEQGLTPEYCQQYGIRLDAEGRPKDRMMWFGFNRMNSHPRFVGALIVVQGLNAITGLPVAEDLARGEYQGPGKPVLEWYTDRCPVHNEPFADNNRFCESCGFNWDPQNFVTNTGGYAAQSEFWRDGWRDEQGKIGEFTPRAAASGKGVAQQVLGSRRSKGIDIALFTSREVKPRPEPTRRYRGSGDMLIGGISKGLPESYGGDDMLLGGGHEEPVFRGIPASATRGGGVASARRPTAGSPPGPQIRRVPAAPTSMEMAKGRQVVQAVHADTLTPEDWNQEPDLVITLMPVDLAWAIEVTRAGPTTKTTQSGPFAGVSTVA